MPADIPRYADGRYPPGDYGAPAERVAPVPPAPLGPAPLAPEPPAPGLPAPVEPEVSGVRPYLITGGRAKPIDTTLAVEAQVAVTPAGRAALDRLSYERRDIVARCLRPTSVAELAAHLGLHLGVVRILVADLVAIGYLSAQRPTADTSNRIQIIERVIRALHTIH